jgi:hypothetical protein
MHVKVFLKLKKPKNSLFWANIYKKKTKKTKKNKKNKKIHWAGFFPTRVRIDRRPLTRGDGTHRCRLHSGLFQHLIQYIF